jgi:acyl carrier protein
MRNSKSLGEMREWLTERIAAALKVRKDEMDPDTPFARYGLQSIDSVIMASKIEEEFGASVEPTLLWEHNTVNLCATHLVELMSDKAD